MQGMELVFESVGSGPVRSIAANRRMPELLKSKHRARSKFDGSAILFDRIVPNISMTGRVGTRDKLVGHARRVLYLRYSPMTK
jgi:hypothetical protein